MNPNGIILLLKPEDAQRWATENAPRPTRYDRLLRVFKTFSVSYEEKRHPTPNTTGSMGSIVPRFLKFVSTRRTTVNEIKKGDVIDYLNSLKDLRTSSRLLHLRIITLFMNWLYAEMGVLKEKFPTVTYKGTADTPRAPQKELNREEIGKIMGNLDKLTETEKVVIQLLLSRPLRIGELSRLQKQDVNMTARTITIERSKNKGTRILSIPDSVYDGFQQLLKEQGGTESVFGMSLMSLLKLVNGVMEKCGIERNGRSTHSLRHTVISRMLHEAHTDIAVVAELAGNTPGTIYRAYNHVPVEAKRQAEKDFDRLLAT